MSAVETLLSRGHALSDLINVYSLRKINALYRAASKNQREENKVSSIAFRYGMNATAREFEKWLMN
jgi:hypothetical protein